MKNRIFYNELITHKSNPSYSDLLNTIDWDIKRHHIFKRDNYKCQKCGSVQELVLHHKEYEPNKLPWDYPDENFITLCNNCHSGGHNKKPSWRMPRTWFRDPLCKKYNIRLKDET